MTNSKYDRRIRLKTYHENVICVWNLASSSEELTKIIKLDREAHKQHELWLQNKM